MSSHTNGPLWLRPLLRLRWRLMRPSHVPPRTSALTSGRLADVAKRALLLPAHPRIIPPHPHRDQALTAVKQRSAVRVLFFRSCAIVRRCCAGRTRTGVATHTSGNRENTSVVRNGRKQAREKRGAEGGREGTRRRMSSVKYLLLVNRQGQTRLSRHYEHISERARVTTEAEIVRKCISRSADGVWLLLQVLCRHRCRVII